jgi:hypothetical protein
MGGSAAPTADPAQGIAATMTAQTGQDALAFAKEQAGISNAWAAADRERWETIYEPMETAFVNEASTYDTAERRNQASNEAQADVQQSMQSATGQRARQQAAMGVRPGSGRSDEGTRRTATDTGLAVAGARNMASRKVEDDGYRRKADAINVGNKYAVNPGTSLGMATASGNSGFAAASAGYQGQANILGSMHNQQMQTWQANQDSSTQLWGGLGTLAGYALMSDENVKENKKPVNDVLGAVRKMRVEKWDYKKGAGDEKSHIGTYAQDFTKATGMGDGKTIDLIDITGVALGAIKELDAKIDQLAA